MRNMQQQQGDRQTKGSENNGNNKFDWYFCNRVLPLSLNRHFSDVFSFTTILVVFTKTSSRCSTRHPKTSPNSSSFPLPREKVSEAKRGKERTLRVVCSSGSRSRWKRGGNGERYNLSMCRVKLDFEDFPERERER